MDGDGVQDMGEVGIGGVPVDLRTTRMATAIGATDRGGTATTDAAGNYIFDQLPAGIYEVRVNGSVTLPRLHPDRRPRPVRFDLHPGFGLRQPDHAPIVLGPGDVFLNADFGYQPGTFYSIGNTVFLDADADGTY